MGPRTRSPASKMRRHRIPNSLAVAFDHILTNARNNASEMHVVDDLKSAHRRKMLVEQTAYSVPSASLLHPVVGAPEDVKLSIFRPVSSGSFPPPLRP